VGGEEELTRSEKAVKGQGCFARAENQRILSPRNRARRFDGFENLCYATNVLDAVSFNATPNNCGSKLIGLKEHGAARFILTVSFVKTNNLPIILYAQKG
jgi:hypothetical protein